jgi:hypothetical protein
MSAEERKERTRQTQPSSSVLASRRPIRLRKRIENEVKLIRLNSDSSVGDAELELVRLLFEVGGLKAA